MTPIFAGTRLDWASAVGLFIINYGMLDYCVLDFLEFRLPREQFDDLKNKHFQDRIKSVKRLVAGDGYSAEQKHDFAEFFQRLDPIRELRNHIAHGHLLVSMDEQSKTFIMTLSLPKNLDQVHASDSRHLPFQELTNALSELKYLIEKFKHLEDPGSDWKPLRH